MSVKRKAKTILFRSLDKLPEILAFRIYHFIQNKISKTSIEHKMKASQGSYSVFERIMKQYGISTEGKTILEIGSGWLPLMPYFFKYLGKAKNVRTYDLNRHYNGKTIKKLNNAFSQQYNIKVGSSKNNGFYLPQGIDYYPNTDLLKGDIAKAELVFSRFVLEHVKPADIKQMHQKFKKGLKPGAFIIHFISPSDHRAYVDEHLSLQDFLKYSEEEWQQKQTKFDYHNRLRLPQYVALFKSLGFEIVHLEYDVPQKNSKTYKRFKELDLHKDFQNHTDEELTAGSINIVLRL